MSVCARWGLSGGSMMSNVLNGAENAGIYVRREILTDPTDLSTRIQLEIAPDDPRWALPFYTFEAATMGWEQNGGWE